MRRSSVMSRKRTALGYSDGAELHMPPMRSSGPPVLDVERSKAPRRGLSEVELGLAWAFDGASNGPFFPSFLNGLVKQ